MVDMAKKVNKKGAEYLNAGETVVAATVIMKPGQFKKNVAFSAIGGVAGAVIANRAGTSDEDASDDTLAASFPLLKQSILAISNQRWIVFEQSPMSGGPKSVSATWTHDQITGLKSETGKVTGSMELTFSDESSIAVEVLKASKPAAFIEAALGVTS